MIAWHETTDIAVVGSGAAGLSAAIEARQLGAAVRVFEKMKLVGGNTRIADGGLSGAGNFMQQRLGVADSPEMLYQDMLRAGLGLNHPRLARLVAEQAAAAIHWTRERLGVRYQTRLDRFGGHSVARSLTIRSHSGVSIVKAQVAALQKLGVTVEAGCLLTQIHCDRHGRVCGLQIRSPYRFGDPLSGMVRNIRALKAVVLASGGFGNDIAFRSLQNPLLDERIAATTHKGATAEALIAALAIKAAPVHLSWIQSGPWACADEAGFGQGTRFASYAVFAAGILVNPASAKRMVNEWGSRRQRADAIFMAGHPCIGIVDAKGAEKAETALQNCLKSNKVQSFPDLSALGRTYQMPAGELESTVRDYNQAIIRSGRDPWGKPLDQGVQPLDTPPFYAIRLWPKVHYTPGGVAINTCCQVLDLHRRPIPGLLAAGEVCGGIHGASRLGGMALPECILFGRIAGRQAAEIHREGC